MEVGLIFFIAAILVMFIWIVVGIKRIKHKIFAMFLISLILFLSISSVVVFKDAHIDFKSVSGLSDASKLYFSWLSSVFVNLKVITMNAVKMNWEVNNSINLKTIEDKE